jgi:hypothetical protein
MTIVMTLRVREDDADALPRQLLFHLRAGVDAIVIGGDLGGVVSEERVHVVQGATPTELAAFAVDELGAEWLLVADAGEFWWPRGARFDELLGSVPPTYATVQAIERPFVPVAEGDEDFAERMLYRASAHAPFGGADGAWRPARRLVCRAGVEIDADAAQAVGRGDSKLRPFRGWYPLEVLSFPERSRDHPDALRPAEIEQGLATGALALDTRVRDALRGAAADGPLTFSRPSIVDDALFAADVAVLGEADVVAARRVMDELEERLTDVENRFGVRVGRKLRSSLGRGSG